MFLSQFNPVLLLSARQGLGGADQVVGRPHIAAHDHAARVGQIASGLGVGGPGEQRVDPGQLGLGAGGGFGGSGRCLLAVRAATVSISGSGATVAWSLSWSLGV